MRIYESPRMPQNWSGEAKNFYLGLIDVLDELHLPIQESWLNDKLKEKIAQIGNVTRPVFSTLNLSKCTAYSDADAPYICRYGYIVQISGAIKLNASLANGSNVELRTTMHNRFCPPRRMVFMSHTADGKIIEYMVDTNGRMRLFNRSGSTIATSDYVPLTLSYIVETEGD